MNRTHWNLWLMALVCGFAMFACGDSASEETHEDDTDDEDEHHHDEHEELEGTPTDSICPDDSTLTYENFGQNFFNTYCQTCHASTITGDSRNDAPEDLDFDTVEDIRGNAETVDELAAGGPSAVNEEMPPTEDDTTAIPSEEERRKLGEWLACDAP